MSLQNLVTTYLSLFKVNSSTNTDLKRTLIDLTNPTEEPSHERKRAINLLNRFFNFFDELFSCPNHLDILRDNTLADLMENTRELNRLFTSVNDDLESVAKKNNEEIPKVPLIKTNPMYKDLCEIWEKLQNFILVDFTNWFNSVKDSLTTQKK